MVRGLVAVISASSLLAACAPIAADGDALPRQPSVDEITAAREPVNGTVVAADSGCLHLEMDDASEPWIVWPPGAALIDGDGARVAASGAEFNPGDVVTGVGARVAFADLPDVEEPGRFFATYGAFCDAESSGVVVLDWLEHAS